GAEQTSEHAGSRHVVSPQQRASNRILQDTIKRWQVWKEWVSSGVAIALKHIPQLRCATLRRVAQDAPASAAQPADPARMRSRLTRFPARVRLHVPMPSPRSPESFLRNPDTSRPVSRDSPARKTRTAGSPSHCSGGTSYSPT